MDEEVDDDEISDGQEQSILIAANICFKPKRRLRMHYRSKHPGLISFSNVHIYDKELCIFPAPDESRDDRGVSFRYVDNSNYGSSTNIDVITNA